MRKFKFVGTEKNRQDYNRLNESGRPVYGTVYKETDMIYGGSTVLHWAEHSKFSHEWKEVFDTLDDKITELKKIAKSKGMDCEVVLKEAPKRIEVVASGYDVNHYEKHSCFQSEFFIYNSNDARDYSYAGLANFLAKQLETYLNDENK